MRSISDIAGDISREWKKVNYSAQPYLEAMYSLSTAKDFYGCDSAISVVSYFLANASTFKGPRAKALKEELKQTILAKSCKR